MTASAFFEALRAGASGYVLKSVADRDLVEACRATMRGEPFLYPASVKALIRDHLDRAMEGEATPDDPRSGAAWSSRELAADVMGGGHLPKYLGAPIRSGLTSGEDSRIDASEDFLSGKSNGERHAWTAATRVLRRRTGEGAGA